MSQKKKGKAKAVRGLRNLSEKTLTARSATGIRGGRKAGGEQKEFLTIKMNEVIITSV